MVKEAWAQGMTRAQLHESMFDERWGEQPVEAHGEPYDGDDAINAWLPEGLTMDDLAIADED